MAARWYGHGWVPSAMATRRRVLRQRIPAAESLPLDDAELSLPR